MFSRYSTGWKCGLHADFTELTECLAAGKLDELEEAASPLTANQRRYAVQFVITSYTQWENGVSFHNHLKHIFISLNSFIPSTVE